MAPAGVFFDLFGTLMVAEDLSRAWAHWLELLAEACARAGLELAPGQLAARCRGFFDRPEPVDAGGGLTVYERRLRRLLDELRLDPQPAKVREIATATVTAWRSHFVVDPDAGGVLASLSARVPLVLVSNFDHPPAAREALHDAGLASYFTEVVISGEVGCKKPDPEIFRGPLERLRLAPDEVVHVGDADEDLRGARAAGLHPVLVRRPRGSTELEAAGFGGGSSPCDVEGVRIVTGLGELRQVLVSPFQHRRS